MQELPCRDHVAERVWRHLETCQYQTLLHARVPRVDCPTHGVRQVRVPWAEARSRFTMLMERLIIDLIQQCSTVTGACRIARVADWLVEHEVEEVVMESTAQYCRPVWETALAAPAPRA